MTANGFAFAISIERGDWDGDHARVCVRSPFIDADEATGETETTARLVFGGLLARLAWRVELDRDFVRTRYMHGCSQIPVFYAVTYDDGEERSRRLSKPSDWPLRPGEHENVRTDAACEVLVGDINLDAVYPLLSVDVSVPYKDAKTWATRVKGWLDELLAETASAPEATTDAAP